MEGTAQHVVAIWTQTVMRQDRAKGEAAFELR